MPCDTLFRASQLRMMAPGWRCERWPPIRKLRDLTNYQRIGDEDEALFSRPRLGAVLTRRGRLRDCEAKSARRSGHTSSC